MSDYKKRVWGIVIAQGAVSTPTERYGQREWVEYYGSTLRYDYEGTLKALEVLPNAEIDWEKTEDPCFDQDYQFTDTFNEPAKIDYMYGTIWTKGGQSFTFASRNYSGSWNFEKLLRNVLGNPPTIQDALKLLQGKVNEAKEMYGDGAEHHFNYCVER